MIISYFIRYALCNYFVVEIQEMKTRLRVPNVAPAAAGNMQELRGKVPKGVAFINDWMDAAELCAGSRNCQQQVFCQLENLYLARAYLSPSQPFQEALCSGERRICPLFAQNFEFIQQRSRSLFALKCSV